jgi:hypothetical protein
MNPSYTAPCHTSQNDSELTMCLQEVQALADKLNAAYNAHHELEVSQGKPDADWPRFYASFLLANGVTLAATKPATPDILDELISESQASEDMNQ